MSPSLSLPVLPLVIAGGVFLVGVLLFIFAWRGRRIDDHPWCRKCRFDLFGLDHPSRCPECGGELSDPRAMRMGQRRKRPAVLIVAILFLIGGLTIGGLGSWSSATGYDWNRAKPTFWLMWDVEEPDSKRYASVVAELARRLQADQLSRARVEHLIELGLDIQGDLNQPWVPEWGDLIETAFTAGFGTSDNVERYYSQALSPSLLLRSPLPSGEAFSIGVDFRNLRISQKGSLTTFAEMTSLNVGGFAFEEGEFQPSFMSVTGTFGGTSAQREVKIVLPEGNHEVISTWKFTVLDHFAMDAAVVTTKTVTLRGTVECGSGGDSSIVFQSDPALREAVRASLKRITLWAAGGTDDSPNVTCSIAVTDTSLSYSFDIILRSGEREWTIGPLVMGGPFQGTHGMALGGTLDGFSGDTLDVVLRPNRTNAIGRLRSTEMWDEDVIFEDVPLERPAAEESDGGGYVREAAPRTRGWAFFGGWDCSSACAFPQHRGSHGCDRLNLPPYHADPPEGLWMVPVLFL